MSDNESALSQKEARTKAEKLLSGTKTVFLATNGSHGHPNVRAMMPLVYEGVETLWFSTSLESSKIIELVKDNKAAVFGYSQRAKAEFRLWGEIAILDDLVSRKRIWTDELKEQFPEGVNDPDLRVLRFNVVSGLFTGKDGKNGIFTI
ncbi:MAG: pyridoxamine 5'-phosphate oxidase family protein [Synergistaceae bacterium]|nr:pyridoxamine 5'-phosphate oxidase family protein [Synergistaceae bacterium]